MAVSGELAKYIGGKLAKNAGKELATKAVTSTLSSIVPKVATKAGTKAANKIGNEFIAGSILNSLAPTTRMLDKAGKPVTFYHSTPNEFDKFDDAMLGSNTGYDNTALGHFVTPDKDFSMRFRDINNTGKPGRTMELQANVKNTILHPYMAGYKYKDPAVRDKIVEDYLLATDNQIGLDMLRDYLEEDAAEFGKDANLYNEYMAMADDPGGEGPFFSAGDERELLKKKGYDAVELIEGPKSGLVEGAKSDAPVSSYAVFSGDSLRPVRHIPVEESSTLSSIIPVKRKLYRGQQYSNTDFSYNSELMNENPDKWGSKDVGKGYHFTPKKGMAGSWEGSDGGVIEVDYTPDQVLKADDARKMIKEANELLADDKYMAKLWQENEAMAEQIEEIADGNLEALAKREGKPFVQHLKANDDELGTMYYYKDIDPELTDRFVSEFKQKAEKYMPSIKPNIQQSKVELSPQQQEFFKDSVVRNENGELIPMYHGTKGDFTIFGDKSPSSSSNSHSGVGHWFTPSEEGAKNFADSIWYGEGKPKAMRTYLNIKNPKVYESVDNSKAVELLRKKLDKIELKSKAMSKPSLYYKNMYDYSVAYNMVSNGDKDMAIKWLSDKSGYDDKTATELIEEIDGMKKLETEKKRIQDEISELKYGDAYERFRTDIYKVDGQTAEDANVGGIGMALNDNNSVQKYVDNLKAEGYDGIIIRGTNYDADTMGGMNDQYVAFYPEQIKNVDNFNPTNNPDIRYATGLGRGSSGFDDSIERIGSEGIPATRKETLPEGWDILEEYLGGVDKRVENAIGKAKSKITKKDLVQFLDENDYDSEGTFSELWQRAKDAVDDITMEELNYAGGGSAADIIQMRRRPDMNNIEDVYMGNKGHTGRLDAEYSNRLGISKSTTPMSDKLSQPLEYAQGDYGSGVIGLDKTWSSGEAGVSNVAHERFHAWQEKSRGFDYPEEFKKAFEELEDEIIPLLHSKDEISKYWNGRNTDYYFDRNEQEARMVQDYLEYKNHTKRYMGGKRKYEYDERIIKPFDKFYAKLRELSKKGIAIPALAGVFGLGALANKKDDKSVDNIE